MNAVSDVEREALELEAELIERDLAQEDLYYFVKRMQDIESPFKPGWHIRELCDVYMRMIRNIVACESPRVQDRIKAKSALYERRAMIQMPPRHSKALADDTLIPTPDGLVPIGDLRPGDFVFDHNGQPTRVTHAHHFKDRPTYRVTTDDGHSVIADKDHLWTVRLCRKRPVWKDHTTEYLANRTSNRSPMIPAHKPLQIPDRPLPVSPYTLGVWLGDGTSVRGELTMMRCDLDEIEPTLNEEGVYPKKLKAEHLWSLPGLRPHLRSLGVLGDKHIPEEYFFGSEKQRLRLLQGLIDTDGGVQKDGQVLFRVCNKRLRDDLCRLVTTLGAKCSTFEGDAVLDGVRVNRYYGASFYMEGAARLPRKAERTRGSTKPNRYLRSITPTGKTQDVTCITVENPEGLFLCTEHCIVTHNSFTTSKCLPLWFLAKYPNKEVIVAGYGQEFVNDFGSWSKGVVDNPEFKTIFPGFEIRKDSKAKNRLVTKQGGGVRFAGAGSAITGRGAHLFVIDDPIKGEKEADSEVSVEDLWKWYWGVARTRLHPGGGMVVMHTRWRTNDLIGSLLRQQEEKRTPANKRWQLFDFPALAEKDEKYRKKGEALHPARYDEEELSELRDNMPERQFLALYQQRPVAEKGNFFNSDFIQLYKPHDLPPKSQLYFYISADFAVGTKEENDPTCIWPYAVDRHGNMYFLPDFVHGRIDSGASVRALFDFIERYQPMNVQIEAGVIRQAIQPLIDIESQKRGIYPSIVSPAPTMDKRRRAVPAQGMFEMGKIFLPDIQRVHFLVLPELLAFDKGDHDDIVDTISLAAGCVRDQVVPTPMFDEDATLERIPEDDEEDEDPVYDERGWTYDDMQRREYEPAKQRVGPPSLFSADW